MKMYRVSVQKDFIAQHYLVGGDWGEENSPHAHHYVLELILAAENLDQHGYLVDILDIENAIDKSISYFRNSMLNELEEFSGLNPSLEHFCRIIWEKVISMITPPSRGSLIIKLWENDFCWASYQHDY
jgi:6-pyruvoyltetrahydropterin/6-carboxytetrahydropterin synthase